MKQELLVPKRCFKCGNVFDLSYDLIKSEESEFKSIDGKSPPNEFLCYDCRDSKLETEGKNGDKNASNGEWLSEDILDDEEYD